MTTEGLAIEVRHADRLCYAMQQSAVPWLHGLTLRNDGPELRSELIVKVSLLGFSDRVECRVDELPVGASLELDAPDLPLRADAFAGLLERTRAALQVEVFDGEVLVAEVARPVDVLAYNEWPGLEALPELLAAFVTPNHPALAPLLRAAGDHLQQATGDGALDGYQRKDPARARAMVDAVHAAVASAATADRLIRGLRPTTASLGRAPAARRAITALAAMAVHPSRANGTRHPAPSINNPTRGIPTSAAPPQVNSIRPVARPRRS